MSDMKTTVLSQYDLEVKKVSKGRGAFIVDTDKGLKRLITYNGTIARLEYMEGLLSHIKGRGFRGVDLIMRNRENELVSTEDEEKYILTDWFYGSECDVKSKSNIVDAAMALGVLHKLIKKVEVEDGREIPKLYSVEDEYKKHNTELKRTKKYIRGRKRKTEFEYQVLSCIDKYYAQCEESLLKMHESGYEKLENECHMNGTICHGNYNYHNIIFGRKNISVVNFERSALGLQIRDLYMFLRKVMEKHSWDIELGHQIIESYSKINPISDDEYEVLKIMLSYPEKFWKLINHYMNGNKSWFQQVAKEKLEMFHLQQFKKEEFVKHL